MEPHYCFAVKQIHAHLEKQELHPEPKKRAQKSWMLQQQRPPAKELGDMAKDRDKVGPLHDAVVLLLSTEKKRPVLFLGCRTFLNSTRLVRVDNGGVEFWSYVYTFPRSSVTSAVSRMYFNESDQVLNQRKKASLEFITIGIHWVSQTHPPGCWINLTPGGNLRC